MLDRTSEVLADIAETEGLPEGVDAKAQKPARRNMLRSAWQFFVAQSFSSLTRRIVILNLAGLIALLAGVLYLSQFRAGLIDARIQSLLTQGEIIAGAIAGSATVENEVDHDRS